MRRAAKLLVKPLRWNRRAWVMVKRRARELGTGTADYIRGLVAADIAGAWGEDAPPAAKAAKRVQKRSQ